MQLRRKKKKAEDSALTKEAIRQCVELLAKRAALSVDTTVQAFMAHPAVISQYADFISMSDLIADELMSAKPLPYVNQEAWKLAHSRHVALRRMHPNKHFIYGSDSCDCMEVASALLWK